MFVYSAYSSSSTLFWEHSTLQSAKGVQQGDSLGPLLFCLTIQSIGLQLNNVKTEIISLEPDVANAILHFLPGAHVVDPNKATLLGP